MNIKLLKSKQNYQTKFLIWIFLKGSTITNNMILLIVFLNILFLSKFMTQQNGSSKSFVYFYSTCIIFNTKQQKLPEGRELPGDVLVFLNAFQKLTAIQHFLVSSSFIRNCVPVNFT